MTYHELVKKVQTALANAKDSDYKEHIAVQVNVTGEAEGAFYIEMVDGVLYVAPYDYNDRDALLTGDGGAVLAVAEGKITLKDAVGEGSLSLEGNYDKILVLSAALSSAFPVKKSTRKTASKKTTKAAEAPAEEKPKRGRKTASKKEETAPVVVEEAAAEPAPVEKKKRTRKTTAKKEEAALVVVEEAAPVPAEEPVVEAAAEPAPVEKKKRTTKKTASKTETAASDKPKKGRKSAKK